MEVEGELDTTEEETPIDSGDDLRDSLAAQFDAAGIDDEAPEAPVEEEAPKEEVTDPSPTEAVETVEKEPSDKDTALKAPVNWSATEREQWSKIPTDVQARIHEREKDMATAMADTSQARTTQDRVDKLGSAYASVLASEGVSDPVQAAEGLFKTVAQLRLGTPQQKAQQIAQLIEHYGVDIQALDSQLVSSPQAQQNTELERMVNERMQPYEQVMQQFNQQQESQSQQARTNADNQVAEFGKTREFLNDVRTTMADLIDGSAKRGEQLPLERAYDMACALNPQVANVISQRKEQEALTGQKQALQSKQAAASTLNGRRGAISSGQGAMGLREQLAASWDGMDDS
jgi:hypothetical protein